MAVDDCPDWLVSIFLFAFHVVYKLKNCLFHSFCRIQTISVLFREKVKFEQFSNILDSLRWLNHHHSQDQVHEALGNLLVSEQEAGVWMELEKVAVSWSENEETVVAISINGRIERWSSKC